MKTWKDISKIKLPLNMRSLGRDSRGYPIPWSVAIGSDGKPDFRVIDQQKTAIGLSKRRCSICGNAMGTNVAFVGGPKSMASHAFVDSPMHEACAKYALKVCPFLAAPKFAYARHIQAPAGHIVTHDVGLTDRPDMFGIGVTNSYDLQMMGDTPVIVASEWLKEVEWYKNGEIYKAE
jgi:hypothetical protein